MAEGHVKKRFGKADTAHHLPQGRRGDTGTEGKFRGETLRRA